MVEEWRPLKYKDLDLSDGFWVSNTGKIFSLNTQKILKTVVHKRGSEMVNISFYGLRKTIKVAIAVAYNFCDGYKNGYCVFHIDGNKLNNNSSNLKWVSQEEVLSLRPIKCVRKRSIVQIDPINNKPVRKYESIADAQRCLIGKITGNIYSALCGNQKTAYGYKWKYI